ncbi:MAG TPA: sulfotransferase [Chitinophagaceae bacterium]
MRQIKMIICHFPISLKKIPLLFVYIILAILSLPFQLIEQLVFAGKIRKQEIDPSPVFILGHWRSGTTFLHQLLSNDKQFGYVNFYSAMFPNSFLWTERKMKPLLNKIAGVFKWKIPFFNKIEYNFDFPCEEDTALINMGSPHSAYWAYAFPQKAMNVFDHTMYFDSLNSKATKEFIRDYLYLLKKISFRHKNKRLLLKSPPNTARIKLLLQIFPDAKFIYINRSPVEIYYSHHKLWEQCLKNYALQEISQSELDNIITQTMGNVFRQYKEDKDLLSETNLCEVDYETLLKNPLFVINEIYECLGINKSTTTEMDILVQIAKARKYTPFAYDYDQEKIKWIEKNLIPH